MQVGDLVRIMTYHNCGKVGVVTEVREVQLKNPVTSVNYLVLYQGWPSPYPFTRKELKLINESR